MIYLLPTYFFVIHQDLELARNIEVGLESAIKDWAFNKYLYTSSEVQEALEKADLANRRAIRLNNPYFPKALPSGSQGIVAEFGRQTTNRHTDPSGR